MIQLLLSLFLSVFGEAPMPTPVFTVPLDSERVAVLHQDGMISLVIPGAGLASFHRSGQPNQPVPQGPIGTAQTPVLTATWTDRAGVTHSVSTPIPSTTPSGVQRATELHNALVAAMQAQYPPRVP